MKQEIKYFKGNYVPWVIFSRIILNLAINWESSKNDDEDFRVIFEKQIYKDFYFVLNFFLVT